jgi:trk system potassium uptake protein TrkA
MRSKFAVIGLGKFGSSIARALANNGAEVLAIDKLPEKVEEIKDEVAYAVAFDTTDAKSLRAQNIHEMDAVVVAIGEDFEAMLLTTVKVMEMNVKRVIARAANRQQRIILEKVGVKEILSPEDEVGKTVAEMLLHPTLKSFLRLPDDYEIVEIDTPPKIANKTLGEIRLREKYNINLVTIRRKFKEKVNGNYETVEHIVGVPRADTQLNVTDILVVLGKSKDVERFIMLNS